MKTIIAGSRHLDDPLLLQKAIAACPWRITAVVTGMASGVDRLGYQWAKKKDLPVLKFPAEWGRYGRSAGPIRNQMMAEVADALLAVWDGDSVGTKDMIERAEKNKLKIYVHKV